MDPRASLVICRSIDPEACIYGCWTTRSIPALVLARKATPEPGAFALSILPATGRMGSSPEAVCQAFKRTGLSIVLLVYPGLSVGNSGAPATTQKHAVGAEMSSQRQEGEEIVMAPLMP